MVEDEKKEVDLRDELPFRVDYADGNFAACKSCGNKIDKDELRFAKMVKNFRFDDASPNWFHFDCFFSKCHPKGTGEIAQFASIRYEDQKRVESKIVNKAGGGEISILENESHQALSSREESDLERLMEQNDFTIHNAQAFTERLAKEVSDLDSENIQSMMSSEKRVQELVNHLEELINETVQLESRLEQYQNLMKNVRDVVFQVQEKENLVQQKSENGRKLLNELESVVKGLRLSPNDENILLSDNQENFARSLQAANALSVCLNAKFHPSLNQLRAVKEQKGRLQEILDRFSKKIFNVFLFRLENAVKSYQENVLIGINQRDLTLPSHDIIHSILLPLNDLVIWLKQNNPSVFNHIVRKYIQHASKNYESEIPVYFDVIRQKLTNRCGTLSSEDSGSGRKGSTIASFEGRQSSGSMTVQESSDSISRSSDMSLSEWEEFDSCIEKMLSAIDPYCLVEQQFCLRFFDIDNQHQPAASENRRPSSASSNQSICASPAPSQSSTDNTDSKRSEASRSMMSEIFSVLERELMKFISYEKFEGLHSMYLYVRLLQHVLSAEDTGSFLVKTYGVIVIKVKRNFDKFMGILQQSIKEAKSHKKTKGGVFSFARTFEQFAKQAESVFRGQAESFPPGQSKRRNEIDRWYTILVKSMFESIDRLALESTKTPPEMVRLENYHYLHDILSTLKIQCLENERKEARKKYNDALCDYVARYFGRPLEKLNAFFEGVQLKVAQGVKANEIGFQMAYSKNELRKVISSCTLKEVKKGLEEMYKKVEKHVCEPESTLIQVIWNKMQREFISQYKTLQGLIETCYHDANITLLFTFDDILQVFQEIARSH